MASPFAANKGTVAANETLLLQPLRCGAASMAEGPAREGSEEKFALTSSRNFAEWLAGSGGSLALTTY